VSTEEIDLKSDAQWSFDNGLRILHMPVLSASNMIEASPAFNWLRQATRWMDRYYDFPVYWHILWADTDQDEARYRYKWENLDEMAWIHNRDDMELIKIPFHATQSTDSGMCTREMREVLNMGEGERFYDVIWNQRPANTVELMGQVKSRREEDDVLPPIVNTAQIAPKTSKTFSHYDQLRLASGMLGPSTWNIYESEHQLMWTLDVLRKYFNGKTLQKFRERSSVVQPGIDIDYIDEVTGDVEPQDDPVIITFNGKVYTDRNVDEAWEIMDIAYSSPFNIELQVVTPGLGISARHTEVEFSSNTEHFNFYEALPKEGYLRQSAKAKIMVNSVIDTDFNQTLGEVVYAGALPVVRDGAWSRLMYGEDYPYRYNGKKNGAKMLLYVINNLDEIRAEWMPKLQERLRTQFHSARWMYEILDQWNRLREDVTWGDEWYDIPKYSDRYTSGRREKAILKALHRCDDVFTMQDFRDEFKRISDNDTDILIPNDGRSPTPHVRYYWALKKAGVVDLCDGPNPRLDKSECDLF